MLTVPFEIDSFKSPKAKPALGFNSYFNEITGDVIRFRLSTHQDQVLHDCVVICRWDPETNRWSFICPMSVARLGAGVAACGGTLYVAGGYDGQSRWDTAEKYLPETNTWQQLAPMSTMRSGLGECVLAFSNTV